MKYARRILVLCALLFLVSPAWAPAWGADAGVQPAAKVVTSGSVTPASAPAAAPVAEPKTDEPTTAAAAPAVATPDPEAGLSWWKMGLKHLMELVFLILGIMATALVRVMMKKYGFEEQSGKVNDVLMKAIGFAEQWAIKKAKMEGAAAPGGAQKMEMAVDFAKKLAVEYKLPDKGSDWWEHKLEGWLGIEKAKANAVATATNGTSS